MVFDPSEPTEDELLAARSVPLEQLREKARTLLTAVTDPFVDTVGLIKAAHAEKLYRYELYRRCESM